MKTKQQVKQCKCYCHCHIKRCTSPHHAFCNHCISSIKEEDLNLCKSCGKMTHHKTENCLQNQEREKTIKDKIYNILKGNYACTRAWSAWQVGTMHKDDFEPLEECEEIIEELYKVVALSRRKLAEEIEERKRESKRTEGKR